MTTGELNRELHGIAIAVQAVANAPIIAGGKCAAGVGGAVRRLQARTAFCCAGKSYARIA